MIDTEKRSTQKLFYAKPLLVKRKFTSKNNFLSITPQQSESNVSRTETNRSIYSSLSSSSNITIDYRQRNQLSHLLSLDFIQSSASFIYPNIRTISSGYKKPSIYIFSNKLLSSNKNIPLVFVGSEYFLRKKIDFEQLKYPISKSEYIEPLIDLFLNRPQFINEIPQLNNLSDYILLPQTISGLLFFDSILNSSARHFCLELNTKENQNKFTIKDLLSMSQRENNIIQINALNDKRYYELINQLNEIYSYKNSSLLIEKKISQSKTRNFSSEQIIKIQSYQRMKTLPSIVTSISE